MSRLTQFASCFVLLCALLFTVPVSCQENEPTNSPSVSTTTTGDLPAKSSNPYLDELRAEEEAGIDSNPFMRELMHMFLMLGLLVALLMVGSWILKKMMSQRITNLNTGSEFKVIERRSLNAKAALYLIEVKGHQIVVGETPHGLHRIADFTQPKDFSAAMEAVTNKDLS